MSEFVMVLPEREPDDNDPWNAGWNACLDKLKGLNTPTATEWHDVAGDDEGLVS